MALFPILLQVFNCQGNKKRKKKKRKAAWNWICENFFSIILKKIPFYDSEEIRGEILFALYKVSMFQYASEDGDGTDVLLAFCPKLLHLVVDALIKTQVDDVRLNCLGLSISFFVSSKFNFLFPLGTLVGEVARCDQSTILVRIKCQEPFSILVFKSLNH